MIVDDSRHCCPHGYQCDIEKSKCVRDISIPWLTKTASIRANYQGLVFFFKYCLIKTAEYDLIFT